MDSINTTHKLSECVDIYSQAERYLIENYIYMPLFYNIVFNFNKSIDGVLYDPFTNSLNLVTQRSFNILKILKIIKPAPKNNIFKQYSFLISCIAFIKYRYVNK